MSAGEHKESVTGYAHFDGEIENVRRCPRCDSTNVKGKGQHGVALLSFTCGACWYEWRVGPETKLANKDYSFVKMGTVPNCPMCGRQTTGIGDDKTVTWTCLSEKCGHTWVENKLPGSAKDIAQEQMKVRVTEKYDDKTVTHGGEWNPYPGTDKVADFPQVVKDRTKARFDLIPYGPLWKMAEVFTNGARKPGRVAHNWRKGTEWSDYYGAMMRHAALFQQGEDFEIDPDTGTRIDHLAAVMCCAAILLEYQMFSLGTDDRFPAGHPAYKGEKK